MKKFRKLLLRFSDRMQLPADVVAGVPRVELIGFNQCSITPHCGLAEYGETEIVVETRDGQVIVHGDRLRIRRMNSSALTVIGRIDSVHRREAGE